MIFLNIIFYCVYEIIAKSLISKVHWLNKIYISEDFDICG